jgi:hypothetical protein
MDGQPPFLQKSERERIEVRLIVQELIRKGCVAPHVEKKITDKKKLVIVPELYWLFYFGLDKENCQPTLPYSGGLMEQPYYELEIWMIFMQEYLLFRKESMDDEMAKHKKPNLKVVRR